MAKRKKESEMGLKQATIGIVGGSVILGAGSKAVVPFSDTIVSHAQAGFTALGSALPPIGGITGAGVVIKGLEKLKKVGKQR